MRQPGLLVEATAAVAVTSAEICKPSYKLPLAVLHLHAPSQLAQTDI
jgi:hypothetical protein